MENKGEQFCLRVNDNENKKISIVIYGTDESGNKIQESDANGRFASIVINDDFMSITRLELRFNRLPEAFTDTETIIGGIMFYKGDSDIAFEPYTGGQPSANPDDFGRRHTITVPHRLRSRRSTWYTCRRQ